MHASRLFGADISIRLKTSLAMLATLAAIAVTDALMGPGHQAWVIFVCFMGAFIAIHEWPGLGRQPHRHPHLWLAAGLLYAVLLPGVGALYILQTNALWLLWCATLVVCADVMALVFGRTFGGPKLWPRLSPNKTWAGFTGGLFSTWIVAILAPSCLNPVLGFLGLELLEPWGPATTSGKLLGAALVVVVATAGDFYESALKRQAGVKDSGTLLPGHGGLFDRLDGHIAAIPLTALLLWWMG